ncbi:MAG: hypothetical protein KKA73_22670 [Chloroflexi bacterium]|nr:hypothetical protein [Chloroflexota bacterium]MBU1750496.1 hypothetical protein [Chloroflexota bacterium]
MARHDWQLLEKDEFVRVVFERARRGEAQTESDLTKIATNEYCQALHRACSAKSSAQQRDREQAYDELARYLYNSARHWWPGPAQIAEEITQAALVDIYQELMNDACRKPGAFLAFCQGRLRGVRTRIVRAQKLGDQEALSWEQITSSTQDNSTVMAREPRLSGGPPISLEEEVERRLLVAELWTELEWKIQKHPRAKLQLQAIFLKHGLCYDNQDIVRILDVASPGAVSTLIYRGKDKLANNQRFEELCTLLLSE